MSPAPMKTITATMLLLLLLLPTNLRRRLLLLLQPAPQCGKGRGGHHIATAAVAETMAVTAENQHGKEPGEGDQGREGRPPPPPHHHHHNVLVLLVVVASCPTHKRLLLLG